MQVSIHLDADGSTGLQCDATDYNPDVFDDLIRRLKAAALELWARGEEQLAEEPDDSELPDA